jgi:hypothetical protein
MRYYTIKELEENFGVRKIKNFLFVYESWDISCLQFYPKGFSFYEALQRQAGRLRVKGYKRVKYLWLNPQYSCIVYKRIK